MVLKKGKVTNRFRFRMGEHLIPLVTEKPVKSLGKVLNCSLNDRDPIHATSADLGGWLKTVSGQVWAPWNIHGLDIPAWNPPMNPLASAHL